MTILEDDGTLVRLNETSSLKTSLNHAIASLFAAPESYLQPRVSLNGVEGLEVLRQIRFDPDQANTEVMFGTQPIIAGQKMWLNVTFWIYLNEVSWPNHIAILSPRQTGLAVRLLCPEAKALVLEKVQGWYFNRFLPHLQQGLEAISQQFTEGDPLVESDYRNRIFDIHGERRMGDLPYTETEVVGAELFSAIVYGGTFLEEIQSYERADQLILARKSRKQAAAKSFLETMRR